MVLLGGLEVLAAGYLIHKHNKNKKERARLEEEAAALEESSYPLFPAESRPPRRHIHSTHSSHGHGSSHSQAHVHDHTSESEEERRERRERRRRRREKEKLDEHTRMGRTNSAPPSMNMSTQTLVAPGVVAGWPAHWKQSQVPPPQPQRPIQPHIQQPQFQPSQYQSQAPSIHQGPPVQQGPNGYPQDVKYGFVPDVPHEQYPSYPPPPFEEATGQVPSFQSQSRRKHREHRGDRGREGDRLEVRGRRERRSVSPMLGVYDEDSRSPGPRVRFSTEDIVLGGGSNPPPRYRV